MKLKTMIDQAISIGQEHGLPIDGIHFIFREVLNYNNSQLYLKREFELSIDQINRLQFYLKKYYDGLGPAQYLLGYTYFYGLCFNVNADVLIPRFETEELVDYAIKVCDRIEAVSVLDLCTGSGCIAISLKYNRPQLEMTASDISSKALKLARLNANKYKLDIEFIESDLFDNIHSKFDIIVTNPPYIDPDDQMLDPLVKKFEPAIALFANNNGMEYYCRIIDCLLKYLKPKGVLLMEIGYQQAPLIRQYLDNYQCFNYRIIQDINKIDRIVEISFLKE